MHPRVGSRCVEDATNESVSREECAAAADSSTKDSSEGTKETVVWGAGVCGHDGRFYNNPPKSGMEFVMKVVAPVWTLGRAAPVAGY
jgi:hypothetical protein